MSVTCDTRVTEVTFVTPVTCVTPLENTRKEVFVSKAVTEHYMSRFI